MNKTLLIIQREYLSRVMKKSFLILTFLVPLLIIGAYAGMIYMTTKSFNDTHATVYVVDQQGDIAAKLKNNRNITFALSSKELQEQIQELKERSENVNILILQKDFFETKQGEFLASGKPNISTQNEINRQLTEIVRDQRYTALGLDASQINKIDPSVTLNAKELSDSGEAKDSNTSIAMGIAIALSILVYIALLLYGSQVMRGIIEEKSSRIVEVVISSVKPFQLMMGKIIGIGLVGLTQFLLWIVLSSVLIGVSSQLVGGDNTQMSTISPGMTEMSSEQSAMIGSFNTALDSIDFPELLISFLFFFFGGYALYSAVFAAIGSAVDNETEAGQFTMPITLPLLLAYVMSFGVMINDPHGTVSMWMSFIPFTSPIAMLVRIPFGVPTWQIVLSIAILIASFLVVTWVAARIYRVGILMYGKKPNFKEIVKWFNYRA